MLLLRYATAADAAFDTLIIFACRRYSYSCYAMPLAA